MVHARLSKLKVDDYTTPGPITVEAEASIERVAEIMRNNGIRHVPVVQGQKAVGIISERDINLLSDLNVLEGRTASDIMTGNPFMVRSADKLDDVAFEMSARKIGSAIVNDEVGNITGIFTATDALNALIEIIRDTYEVD